ncbi:MAG: hypothetical protein A3I66_01340 [Burkholderiales bacterium RIFCSPLOWO2_02_FULL_57_36]|nr:MAG: hypothetical protein A3I66_01340 [Burkholderiales bacterium RIFCSPLOWO2_02_FULL_57_36]
MRLSDDSATDLFRLICGPELGSGQYRQVYEHIFDKKLVVKHDSGTNWSNVNEFQIWCEFRDTPLGKWLAPVEWISPRGLWIVQARTKPIPIGKFPKKVPALFADLKPSNWGMYKGRPVCHDYGNHSLYTVGRASVSQLKPVVWEHHL